MLQIGFHLACWICRKKRQIKEKNPIEPLRATRGDITILNLLNFGQ